VVVAEMSLEVAAAEEAKGAQILGAWFYMFGDRNADALEAFKRAGANYQAAHSWAKAASMYEKVAALSTSSDAAFEGIECLKKAAICYKHVSINDTERCAREVADKLSGDGKFSSAASALKQIANALAEGGSPEAYECAAKLQVRAADLHSLEGQTASASDCMESAAEAYVAAQRFGSAAQLYETAAAQQRAAPKTSWALKTFVVKAALSHFCEGAKENSMNRVGPAIDHLAEEYADFAQSEERKLLDACVSAWADQDAPQFREMSESLAEKVKRPWDNLLFQFAHKLEEPPLEETAEDLAFLK